MEATRTALESEHKLQLLQMQAINALWKKVVSLQPGGNRENTFGDTDNTLQPNADVVNNLAQTCNLLHTQVRFIFRKDFYILQKKNFFFEYLISFLFYFFLTGPTVTRFDDRDKTLHVQHETEIRSC